MKSLHFKMTMQMTAFLYLRWEEVLISKKEFKKIGGLLVGYKLGERGGRKAEYLFLKCFFL